MTYFCRQGGTYTIAAKTQERKMTPQERAKELLFKYDVRSPSKLNLEEIANAENIIVEEEEMKGILGKIIYEEGYRLIKINNSITRSRTKKIYNGTRIWTLL